MLKHTARSVVLGVVGVLAGTLPAFAQSGYEGEFDPRSSSAETRVISAPALVFTKSSAKPNPTPIGATQPTAAVRPAPAAFAPSRTAAPVVLAAHEAKGDRITFNGDVEADSASVREVAPNASLLFSEPADLTVRPGLTDDSGFIANEQGGEGPLFASPQQSVFAVPADQDRDLIARAASMHEADKNQPVYYTTQYAQPQTTSYGHQFPSAMGSQPTRFAEPVSGTRVIIHYEHGHARHHCDSGCSYYRSRHYSHGHARHLCDDHCDHHRSHSYAHGHHRHVCDARCNSYFSVGFGHGHARHLCNDHCNHYRATHYRHGHPRHSCSSSCGSYFSISFSHGHSRHLCGSHCSHWFSSRYSHGHARHSCDSHCGHHSSRRYSHGHARHSCDSHCSHYSVRVHSGHDYHHDGRFHYDSRRARYLGGYHSPIYRHRSHSSSSFEYGRHGKSSSFHFGLRISD